MEYSVEDLSPVRKKVVITTESQEVDAAIMGAVALYKTDIQLDGFRKGKAPASLIEKRFHDKIYQEARENLINVHINDVMQKMGVTPLAGITVDADNAFERGTGYTYSVEFEVLPVFDLPPYEGMEVEQEKVNVTEADVQRLMDHIRRAHATLVPVEGGGPATDGQIVNIGFAAYEGETPLEGVKSDNFDLALGEHQALEAFENLVKTVPNGGEGEGPITFPTDFIASDLAGKTVTMKVKVYAIKERKLPEVDDAFAKSLGQETVDKLQATLTASYTKSQFDLNKSAAQKKLLDSMLKMVEFTLPSCLVENAMRSLLNDMAARLERQGRRLESLGKSLDELRKEMQPRAEELARSQVLLLAIAKKEGLDVTETEVSTQLYRMCLSSGEDFKTVRETYERTGMIFVLRDRMLADKAMDLVYAKAKVTEVDPPQENLEANPSETGDDVAPEAASETQKV